MQQHFLYDTVTIAKEVHGLQVGRKQGMWCTWKAQSPVQAIQNSSNQTSGRRSWLISRRCREWHAVQTRSCAQSMVSSPYQAVFLMELAFTELHCACQPCFAQTLSYSVYQACAVMLQSNCNCFAVVVDTRLFDGLCPQASRTLHSHSGCRDCTLLASDRSVVCLKLWLFAFPPS